MNKFNIAVLILFLACGDTSQDSKKKISSTITNPIFLGMFIEYQGILDEYEAIMRNMDSDDFSKISNIESIAKRVSGWIDKWEKEIKEADLSHEEKIEIINEYERISRKYRN
jgi:hypothetical protein